MKFILQPHEGERVSLSAPLCGEILVKTDPAIVGGQMVMAVQTIPPGGVIPTHRYLQYPLFIWVAKGQGRVTVEGFEHTVVPGNAVVVPTGQWYGLRNTGTGLFQIVWVAPASLVLFFRSLGQAAQPMDHAALQLLAQPQGIEFQSPEGAPAGAGAARLRHSRRRFHQRSRHQSRPSVSAPQAPQPPAQSAQPAGAPVLPPIVSEPEIMQPVMPAAAQAKPAEQRPRSDKRYPSRNRRRRPNRPAAAQATGSSIRPSEAPTPAAPAPAQAAAAPSRPSARRQSGRRPSGRHGHFKEVFMNGRWVRVSGEGPIVASGD